MKIGKNTIEALRRIKEGDVNTKIKETYLSKKIKGFKALDVPEKKQSVEVPYMSEDMLGSIQEYILSKFPVPGNDFPTVEQAQEFILAEIAKIPVIQGEKGEDGKQGEQGKQGMKGEKGERGERGQTGAKGERGEDGSPDTPEDIIEKIRSLPEGKKLRMQDIKGLEERIRKLKQIAEEVEILRDAIEGISITIPAFGDSGGSTPGKNVYENIGVNVQNGASVVTEGYKGLVFAPAAGTIQGYRIQSFEKDTGSDIVGSVEVTIKKNGVAIGTAVLENEAFRSETDLSSWSSTTVLRGDKIEFVVDSASDIKNFHLSINTLLT